MRSLKFIVELSRFSDIMDSPGQFAACGITDKDAADDAAAAAAADSLGLAVREREQAAIADMPATCALTLAA